MPSSPRRSRSAYVAAKHGIAGLTKTVALEVATHGITVNAIAPGYVWTPLVEKQIPDTMKARGLTKEQVINDVLLAGAADQGVRHRRAGRRRSPSSCAPTRRSRSPARPCRSMAAGPPRDRTPQERATRVEGLAGPKAEKTVSLALQGGGAHGAFTWGVLDAILEDGRLAIEALSGTSAGAMNAVVLSEGWLDGGADGARARARGLLAARSASTANMAARSAR